MLSFVISSSGGSGNHHISYLFGLCYNEVVSRSLKPKERILPGDDWCQSFAYYANSSTPKYNDQQIETLAMTGGAEFDWCVLCDGKLKGSRTKHVREHMRQLRTWKAEREARMETARVSRLAEARAERKRQKELGIS